MQLNRVRIPRRLRAADEAVLLAAWLWAALLLALTLGGPPPAKLSVLKSWRLRCDQNSPRGFSSLQSGQILHLRRSLDLVVTSPGLSDLLAQ